MFKKNVPLFNNSNSLFSHNSPSGSESLTEVSVNTDTNTCNYYPYTTLGVAFIPSTTTICIKAIKNLCVSKYNGQFPLN